MAADQDRLSTSYLGNLFDGSLTCLLKKQLRISLQHVENMHLCRFEHIAKKLAKDRHTGSVLIFQLKSTHHDKRLLISRGQMSI